MGERLESWKEIASYLGREVRTVQRWSVARRLPVHRLPGDGGRPRVFSLKAEVDTWLLAGGGGPAEGGVSVAVLPFANLGGSAEDQYFGDGLADDVINALVRIPGLRVIARTSSFALAAKGQDVRDIGARLGAAWLIEGSVRRDRDRVRVSAQLVNTRDGGHAWSECYDRQLAGLFEIQDDIARAIAVALKVRLACGGPAVSPTGDPVAYDLWVKGRSASQQFTPATFAQARECYEAAIARDPQFARPYFGLADLLFAGAQFGLAESAEVLPRARAAIATSLELDGQHGDAHALSGVFAGILDYDWPAAEAAFRRALELSPGSAAVLTQHAWYFLVPRMCVAEAVEGAQRAVALDPLSPRAHGRLGMVLVAARQYARAVEECRTAVRLAPGLWWLHWFYGSALLLDGKTHEGLRHARRACEEIRQPLLIGGMSLFYGLYRHEDKAAQLLAELQDLHRTVSVPALAFAFAYLGVGDDRVFDYLAKAIDAREPAVALMPSLPFYDRIRDDPRFRALLGRMHLG